ncbi:hypothetical protein SAY86_016481 [Trapa natans]|uniref:ETFB lysine methyltransferase n=1 Tax=Trapa natans TaxID=22666 RepID=A0AAN7LD93_TRANT|nr:hypothetical protein SAY86_016481 [Trapa natans]
MSASHFVKHLFRLNPRQPPSFHILSCISAALSRFDRHCGTDCFRQFSSSVSPSRTTTTKSTCLKAMAASEPLASFYYSVRIQCKKDMADVLSDALLCFGASSVSIDEEDGPPSSNEVSVDSIFPPSEDVDTCISSAADSIGLEKVPVYEVEMRDQGDWIMKTQESFHPIEVAEGLWIVPQWETTPDVNATNIILNPGLAFGTGEHPSTKLCLQMLHGLIKGGENFLDYGTGSGILAIAALKLGASLADGVDVDPVALSSARENAALNNITPGKMRLCLVPDSGTTLDNSTSEDDQGRTSPDIEFVLEKESYDIVIANILLNPLLELADQIVSYSKPGATVAVSGILSEQVPYIIGRYSGLLDDISVSELDEWACVSGRKKDPAGSRV